MFFTDAVGTPGEATTVIRGRGLAIVAIAVTAAGTVLLGVLPSPVLELLAEAASFLP